MPSLRLSEEQIVNIRKSVQNGTKTRNEIAAELGVGERSVRNLLNGYTYGNIEGATPIKHRYTLVTPEKKEEILRVYNETKSMYKVTNITGISRNTVAKYLKAQGVVPSQKPKKEKIIKPLREKKPKAPRVRKERIYFPPAIGENKLKLIKKFAAAGWTYREVAQMLDISAKDVPYYLKDG